MINIDEIEKILPHRYPFLLVDRVIELQIGAFAKGMKNVSANEPYFVGHFPSHKVMPGVLIIEAMAQLAAILASKTVQSQSKIVYLVGIDHARFRKTVTPGDILVLEVKIIQQKGPIWKFDAMATVNDKKAASASISAMTGDTD